MNIETVFRCSFGHLNKNKQQQSSKLGHSLASLATPTCTYMHIDNFGKKIRCIALESLERIKSTGAEYLRVAISVRQQYLKCLSQLKFSSYQKKHWAPMSNGLAGIHSVITRAIKYEQHHYWSSLFRWERLKCNCS